MLSATYNAVGGLQRATTSLNKAAQNRASAKEGVAKDMVETIKAEGSFKSNSKVIQAEDEMIGTVIDLLA